MRFIGTVGSAVGIQAPAGGVSFLPALMAGIVGVAGPFSFGTAVVVMLFVAYAFVVFTREFASAGSVYSFCGRAYMTCLPVATGRHVAMLAAVTMTADLVPVSTETDRLAASRLLRVLADPTRMGIVELLAAGDRTVGELADALGSPRSRLGNHLACGLHCGVWTSQKRGRHMVYSLADRQILALLEFVRQVAAPHAEHLASCHRIGPDWT